MIVVRLKNRDTGKSVVSYLHTWRDTFIWCEERNIQALAKNKQSLLKFVQQAAAQLPPYCTAEVVEMDASVDPWDAAKIANKDVRSVTTGDVPQVSASEALEKSMSNSTVIDKHIADTISRQIAKELEGVRIDASTVPTHSWQELLTAQKNDPKSKLNHVLRYVIHRIINKPSYFRDHTSADAAWEDLEGKQTGTNFIKAIVQKNPHLVMDALREQREQHDLLRNGFPRSIQMVNGKEHIGLTRGLNSNQHGKDKTLASYGSVPDTGFGKYMHRYLVPLDHVWHMYDVCNSGKADYDSENEVLVDNQHPRMPAHQSRVFPVVPYEIRQHTPGTAEYDSQVVWHALKTYGDCNHIPIGRLVSALGGRFAYYAARAIVSHKDATPEHIKLALNNRHMVNVLSDSWQEIASRSNMQHADRSELVGKWISMLDREGAPMLSATAHLLGHKSFRDAMTKQHWQTILKHAPVMEGSRPSVPGITFHKMAARYAPDADSMLRESGLSKQEVENIPLPVPSEDRHYDGRHVSMIDMAHKHNLFTKSE
jgi:hypothetical protein